MVSYRVRRFLVVSAVLVLLFLLLPARAYVQAPLATEAFDQARDWNDDIPAHLTFVDGQVTLERDGRLEPAEANLALLAGDRLRTLGGRVEILFADGSTLAVDEDTELDLLSDSLVRLLEGRLRVAIPRTTEDLDYRIDAPAGSVWIRVAGEYRVETGVDRRGDPQIDLTVFRGSAELVNDFGRTLVRAGRHAVASADAEPSLPYAVNSAAWDDFDRWVEDRRDARVGPVSAAYLPEDVRYYSGAFDAYGTWAYEAPYGNVWYPRVAADWRPYWQGRWSFTAHFGWLWVGIDRWSWPTHHYGRWGISADRWYWIPDRRWAPAWVSWASAPGYVSWCPLGFDGRPVIGFRSVGAYSVDPWVAWTVVPSRQFTHNIWVTEHVVGRNAVPSAARAEFTERRVAPVPVGVAVPRREIAPLRGPTAPGNRAIPRTRATGVGPFDAARTDSRVGATTTRGSVNSTIIGTPPRGDQSRVSPDARPAPPERSAPTPSRVPRPSATRIDVPRIASPTIDVPRVAPNPPAPSRALPRRIDPPPSAPPTGADSPRTLRRAPASDRSAPAGTVNPPPSRGRAVERNASPPSPPVVRRGPGSQAPPPSAAPARSAAPPRPTAPPPSAAAPPSRGRGGEPAAKPPTTGPPTTAPPTRGGGGGDPGKAVPRRAGGRGGGGR